MSEYNLKISIPNTILNCMTARLPTGASVSVGLDISGRSREDKAPSTSTYAVVGGVRWRGIEYRDVHPGYHRVFNVRRGDKMLKTVSGFLHPARAIISPKRCDVIM